MSRPVQVLQRAMKLLTAFDHDHPEMGVTELAQRLDLHKATVHRILFTLELEGFVQQNPATGKYRLGFRLFELGALAAEQISLRREALPFLEKLRDECRETVDLAVYDNGEMVYLEVLESPLPIKIAARPGRRLPVYCTASGKAYLAYAGEEDLQTVLSQEMIPCTPNTICDPEALQEDLRLTRERGYSISLEEYEIGIKAVAAPIINGLSRVEAVIAIAGPAYRLPPERVTELGEAVRQTARELSRHLGGRLTT
ncbi:MAG: IclR family transcriptional regulator [Anaerolineae bacterium]|nr:IclR family transcriptional regulator [Anaerolineae bacterium]